MSEDEESREVEIEEDEAGLFVRQPTDGSPLIVRLSDWEGCVRLAAFDPEGMPAVMMSRRIAERMHGWLGRWLKAQDSAAPDESIDLSRGGLLAPSLGRRLTSGDR